MMAFWAFLLSYFVMTCGLSFLETSANPYVLSMGPEETATRRLNFAQAFNPIGSLTGMLIAKNFILARLDKTDEAARRVLMDTSPDQFAAMRQNDLNVIVGPYMVLGLVVLAIMVVFALARLPRSKGEEDTSLNVIPTLKRLLANRKYLEGVVAQTFYVGAQIMCWTFIIQYAGNELGMAKETAQWYNMIAMGIFVSSRFICTALLKYFSPGGLLMTLAIGGFCLVFGTIFLRGMTGLYCLIGVSACMSLMFPTIYGIALKGLGEDAKLGAAGLIMAIGGGCLMPPLQGRIMDMSAFNLGFMTLSSTRASFVLPLICFVVIATFGLRTWKVHRHTY
jgi:FHS family L-fucose permease-like MFS transporter